MTHDGGMELADLPTAPEPETLLLEGTYTEQDLRAFSAFLANRTAGAKLWTLAAFMLMPLFWTGNLRQTWPLVLPVGLVLLGFIFLLRFRILPARLYKAAVKLPGVFDPRVITIDAHQVRNASEAGSHTFLLQQVQEVVSTPEHLFVMVAPRQGVPIPRSWIGGEARTAALVQRLLSRRATRA